MLVIGLTGSIATGKSTVSNLLSQPPYSLPIIDADLLARQVVEPGTKGYKQIVQYFGPSTPDLLLPPPPPENPSSSSPSSSSSSSSSSSPSNNKNQVQQQPLNRAALGRRVFGSTPSRKADRQILNSIIHPLVRRAMLRSLLYYHFLGHWACIFDIPLLYESGLDIFAGVVVMVAVRDPEIQMQRLRNRDRGLSAKEAADRVGSQMGVLEKVGRTEERSRRRGKVVWNDRDKEQLEKEVERVMGEVKREGWGDRWWWRSLLWGSPVLVLVLCLWEVWEAWMMRKRWEKRKTEEKKEG